MQASPSHIEAITQAITAATEYRFQPFKPYQLRSRFNDQAPSCPYCRIELASLPKRQVALNFIVPRNLGGPESSDNLVPCCRPCALRKSYNDLLAWSPFAQLPDADRAPLLQRRSEILLQSRNHLTPHSPNADRSTVIRHLENRFAFPRFLVFAAHGLDSSWIGWHDKTGAPQAHDLAAVLLRYQALAAPVSASPITLFQVDNGAFLDVIWALIEHHALVQPMAISGLAPPSLDASDWRRCWSRTFTGIRDVTRRHSLLEPEVAPSPPVQLSQSYGAIWMRKRKEAIAAPLRKANDRRAWLQAKADYEDRMKHDGLNGLPGMSAMEIVDGRLEILRLERIYKGIEAHEKAPG